MPDEDMDLYDDDGDPFAGVSFSVPEAEEEESDDEPEEATEATDDAVSDPNDLLTQDREWVDKTVQRLTEADTEELEENADLPDAQYTFLPGLGYVVANCAINTHRGRDEGYLGDKRLTWWNDESIMPKYPYLLINPIPMASTLSIDPDNMPNGEFSHFRKIFDYWEGDQWVISDSGGFQVMSRGGEVVDTQEEHSFADADIHPPTLAEWQVAAADAGTMLDIPPYIITPNEDPRGDTMDVKFSEWVEEIFEPSLEQSTENARRMQDRWEDIGTPGFERFGVIQGQPASATDSMDDWELLRRWHTNLEDVGTWEGMSLKPHPFSDFGNIAFFLGYAGEFLQDYDKIHVLQIGSIYMRALLMYYSMLTGQEVTSDATGYNMGSQYRSYSIPWNLEQKNRLRRMVLSERDDDDDEATRDFDVVDIPYMPCSCEVCRHIDDVAGPELFIEQDGDVTSATLLNLHNLQQALEIGRTIQGTLRGVGVAAPEGLIIQNGSVKAKKNLFWEIMADLVTDSKLIYLHNAMKYVRTSYEEGIDVAAQNWSTPWFKESDGGIHRGGDALSGW